MMRSRALLVFSLACLASFTFAATVTSAADQVAERVSDVSNQADWLAKACTDFIAVLPRIKPKVDDIVNSGFSMDTIIPYVEGLGLSLIILVVFVVLSIFIPPIWVICRWVANCCGGFRPNRSGCNWVWQQRRDETCRGYSREERLYPQLCCLLMVPIIAYAVSVGQIYNDTVSTGINDIFVDGLIAIEALDDHMLTIGDVLTATATQIVNEITDGIPALLYGNVTLGTRIQKEFQALKDEMTADLRKLQCQVDKAKADLQNMEDTMNDALDKAKKAREEMEGAVDDSGGLNDLPPINDQPVPPVTVPPLPPEPPVPTHPPVDDLPIIQPPATPPPVVAPPSVPGNPFNAITPRASAPLTRSPDNDLVTLETTSLVSVMLPEEAAAARAVISARVASLVSGIEQLSAARRMSRSLLQLPTVPTPTLPTTLPNLDLASNSIDSQWDNIGADIDSEVDKLNVQLNITIRGLLSNAVQQVDDLAAQIAFATTDDGVMGKVRGIVSGVQSTIHSFDYDYRYPIFSVVSWLLVAVLVPGAIGTFLSVWWWRPHTLFRVQTCLSFFLLFLTLLTLAIYFPITLAVTDICDVADELTLKTLNKAYPDLAPRAFEACLADENVMDALNATNYIQQPLLDFKATVNTLLAQYLNVDNFFDFGGNANLTSDVSTIGTNMDSAVNSTLNDRVTMTLYLSAVQTNISVANSSLTTLIQTLSPATFNYSDSRVWVALEALNNQTTPQGYGFTLQNYTSLNITWFTPVSRLNITKAKVNLDYEVALNQTVNLQVEILRAKLIAIKAHNDAAGSNTQAGLTAQDSSTSAAADVTGTADIIAQTQAAFQAKAHQLLLSIRSELNEALSEIGPRVLAKIDTVVQIIINAAHSVATCGFVGRFYRAVKTDICVTVKTSVSLMWVVGAIMSLVLLVLIVTSVLLTKRAGFLYSGDKTLHPYMIRCLACCHRADLSVDYNNGPSHPAEPEKRHSRFGNLGRHLHRYIRLPNFHIEAHHLPDNWVVMDPKKNEPLPEKPVLHPTMQAMLEKVKPGKPWVKRHPDEPFPAETNEPVRTPEEREFNLLPSYPWPHDTKPPGAPPAEFQLEPEYHHPGADRVPVDHRAHFHAMIDQHSPSICMILVMLHGTQVTMPGRLETRESAVLSDDALDAASTPSILASLANVVVPARLRRGSASKSHPHVLPHTMSAPAVGGAPGASSTKGVHRKKNKGAGTNSTDSDSGSVSSHSSIHSLSSDLDLHKDPHTKYQSSSMVNTSDEESLSPPRRGHRVHPVTHHLHAHGRRAVLALSAPAEPVSTSNSAPGVLSSVPEATDSMTSLPRPPMLTEDNTRRTASGLFIPPEPAFPPPPGTPMGATASTPGTAAMAATPVYARTPGGSLVAVGTGGMARMPSQGFPATATTSTATVGEGETELHHDFGAAPALDVDGVELHVISEDRSSAALLAPQPTSSAAGSTATPLSSGVPPGDVSMVGVRGDARISSDDDDVGAAEAGNRRGRAASSGMSATSSVAGAERDDKQSGNASDSL